MDLSAPGQLVSDGRCGQPGRGFPTRCRRGHEQMIDHTIERTGLAETAARETRGRSRRSGKGLASPHASYRIEGDQVSEASELAAFGYELGILKRMRRAGWWQVGVRDPESVAEHSLRVAQLAGLLAAEEGADPARAAYLAIWHDSQETRTGDLPHTVRPYLTKPDPKAITADQTAALPARAGDSVRDAIAEYEAAETAEARCARDADKLEMVLQALEYRDLGVQRVQEWIDSGRGSLTTKTAQHVADAALELSPLAWRTA